MTFQTKLKDSDFHSHIRARMFQRGVTKKEIEKTLCGGYNVDDARRGTSGKAFVFKYNKEWEGKFYKEKEVRVYYKFVKDNLVLLTVKAKYGKAFLRD